MASVFQRLPIQQPSKLSGLLISLHTSSASTRALGSSVNLARVHLRPTSPRFSTSATPSKISSPIAIIGAGPCGLTFARLLERSNIDCIVYERDPPAAPELHHKIGVGGSLDIHTGTGQEALERCGLLEEFKKLARYDATELVIADQAGVTKRKVGPNRDAPEIDRTQLRQLLLNSIPAEKINWDHGVKAVSRDESSGGWTLKFANDSTASGFRLIVGADGAWSKIRPLVR